MVDQEAFVVVISKFFEERSYWFYGGTEETREDGIRRK